MNLFDIVKFSGDISFDLVAVEIAFRTDLWPGLTGALELCILVHVCSGATLARDWLLGSLCLKSLRRSAHSGRSPTKVIDDFLLELIEVRFPNHDDGVITTTHKVVA